MQINSYSRCVVAVSLLVPAISYTISSRSHIQIDAKYIYAAIIGILSVFSMVVLRRSSSKVKDGRLFQSDDILGFALSILITVSFTAFCWDRMINHDTAWCLIATSKWIHGARLYVDIVEVNPPLFFYYTVPPIAMADLLRISVTNAQYVALGMLIFISLSWSWDIICNSLELQRNKRFLFFLGIGAAIIFPSLADIAQREQLLVVFLMPWFFGQIAKNLSSSEEVQLAVFAMLGICLKPYYILFPIFVTVWQVIAQRSVRPVISVSNISMLVVGIGYILFVIEVHPEYVQEIVPIARAVYVGEYILGNKGIMIFMIVTAIFFMIVTSIALLASISFDKSGGFIAVTLAGLGCYLWQGHYFFYHTIPFVSFGLLGCIWISMHTSIKSPAFFSAIITITMLMTFFIRQGIYQNKYVEYIKQKVEPYMPLNGVIVLSTYVHAGPIVALNLNTDWVSRYPTNWTVPGAVNRLAKTDCKADPQKCVWLKEIIERNRLSNLNDIEAYKPELLIVDKQSGYFEKKGFSWYEFLNNPSHKKSLKLNDLLMGYRLVESAQRFDFWIRK